jgi:hypothetical protein
MMLATGGTCTRWARSGAAYSSWQSQFKVHSELSGRYQEFPYGSCPHAGPAPLLWLSPLERHMLWLMNPYYHTTTLSP